MIGHNILEAGNYARYNYHLSQKNQKNQYNAVWHLFCIYPNRRLTLFDFCPGLQQVIGKFPVGWRSLHEKIPFTSFGAIHFAWMSGLNCQTGGKKYHDKGK